MRKIKLITVVSMIVLGALLTDGSDVDEINEKRRAFAVEHKIANMYKLEHDQNLQALLDKQKVEEICDTLYEKWYQYRHEFETTNSTRWFMVPSDEDTEKYENQVFTYLFREKTHRKKRGGALLMSQKTNFTMEILNKEGARAAEYMMPTQRKVVCRNVQCTLMPKHLKKLQNSLYISLIEEYVQKSYKKACLIGPNGNFQDLFHKISPGTAGSNCESYGAKNENGLCVPIPPTTTTTSRPTVPTTTASVDNSTTPLYRLVAQLIPMVVMMMTVL